MRTYIATLYTKQTMESDHTQRRYVRWILLADI